MTAKQMQARLRGLPERTPVEQALAARRKADDLTDDQISYPHQVGHEREA